VLPVVLGRWGMYEFVEPHVRRLVADHLGVGVEELVPELSLRDDLAADSLDLVELALALEERFGIGVPEHILDQVRSYGDLVETTVDLIRSRRAAQSRSAAPPAHFVARIVPAEGRSDGILERGGWLTPYTVETIAEDALRAGCGARLEVTVAASTEDTDLARVRDDFACLGERGILVTVSREDENGVPDQHPPVAGGATTNGRPPLTSELLNLLTGVPTAVTITEYFGEDPWQAEDMIACTGKDGRRFGDATPAEQAQALSGRGPYQFVESERGVAGDRATAGDHHVHALSRTRPLPLPPPGPDGPGALPSAPATAFATPSGPPSGTVDGAFDSADASSRQRAAASGSPVGPASWAVACLRSVITSVPSAS